MSAGLTRSQLIDQMSHTTQEGAASSSGYRIAASNATDLEKSEAHVTCDATADEEQINDAFAAASSSGGVVSLSSGDFYVSTPIIFDDSYLTLAGQGGATVIRAADSLNDNIIEIDNSERRYGCSVRDLRINGNKGNQTSGNGIDWTGMHSGRLINLDITSVYADGIYANAQSLGAATTVSNRVTGCNIGSCGSRGMYLKYVYAWVIDGNFYIGLNDTGLFLSSCGDLVIANNGIDLNTSCGIYIYGGTNIHILGQRYLGENNYGIRTDGTPAYVTIAHNNIQNNQTCGLYLKNGSYITVDANQIIAHDDTQGTGIDILAAVSGITITKNVFANTTNQVVDAGASNVIISGNQGYIGRGEVRTISGTLAGVTPAGIMLSVDNPFGQAVRVLDVDIDITTQGATSGTMCVGVGSSATTDYATIFSVLPCHPGTSYPYFYRATKTATYGVLTSPINWATGSGNRYLNFYAHAANNGLVATYTVTVMGV